MLLEMDDTDIQKMMKYRKMLAGAVQQHMGAIAGRQDPKSAKRGQKAYEPTETGKRQSSNGGNMQASAKFAQRSESDYPQRSAQWAHDAATRTGGPDNKYSSRGSG